MNRCDRHARLALTIIVGVVVIVFVLKTAEPYRMARQAQAEAQELSSRVKGLQQANELSERKLRSLQSPRGIEIEARRQHYIRPTEVPVRVAYDDGRSVDDPLDSPPDRSTAELP